MSNDGSPLQGSFFEEDYLRRTQSNITSNNHVALTELVANAWDAGASKVRINIPDEDGGFLTIEDDGTGMTPEEFKKRWMTLGYSRVANQGNKVEFPSDRKNNTRWAFGRNGVGRHGLLCFADEYKVSSMKEGKGAQYTISISQGEFPFVLKNQISLDSDFEGTRLKVKVDRNLPDPDKIREILSARFLHDPKFEVIVNDESIPLMDHPGFIKQDIFFIGGDKEVKISFVDSMVSARTKHLHGIAFWVGGRLVGEPSWVLGDSIVIDGRLSLAKRYTFVISSDVLFDEVYPDWSGFKQSALVVELYKKVYEYVQKNFKEISKEKIKETKESIVRENSADIRGLKPLARKEVDQFIDDMIAQQSIVQSENLSMAVKAVINLEKSRCGQGLLEKLSQLSDDDIEGLDRLLGDWTVRDALAVLDEIDNRISVVEAIEKLAGDPSTDELHTLHPLITQARWIFGYQFDTPEYASNITLRNAVKKVFKKKISKEQFENSRKRPDLLILSNSTLCAVAIEAFEGDSTLIHMKEALLIELKKGASTIGKKEMSQAVDYIDDISNCGLDGTPNIKAFVVGHSVSAKVSNKRTTENNNVKGVIEATTYNRLVRTANKRLFALKEKLTRYEEVTGLELFEKVLGEPEQLELSHKE